MEDLRRGTEYLRKNDFAELLVGETLKESVKTILERLSNPETTSQSDVTSAGKIKQFISEVLTTKRPRGVPIICLIKKLRSMRVFDGSAEAPVQSEKSPCASELYVGRPQSSDVEGSKSRRANYVYSESEKQADPSNSLKSKRPDRSKLSRSEEQQTEPSESSESSSKPELLGKGSQHAELDDALKSTEGLPYQPDISFCPQPEGQQTDAPKSSESPSKPELLENGSQQADQSDTIKPTEGFRLQEISITWPSKRTYQNIRWPTIAEFTVELGKESIEAYIEKRKCFIEELQFCVHPWEMRADIASHCYIYQVIFSTPTKTYPVPAAMASVFFHIEVPKTKPTYYPVEVSYCYEGCRYVHRPRHSDFSEEAIIAMMESKLISFQSIRF